VLLSTLQEERNLWIAHNFPDGTLEDCIFGAVEEMGELAHHFLKRKQGIRGDDTKHEAGMLDSVADAVIFLAGVPTYLGVNYGELVQATWNMVRTRDWVRYPENGRTA